MGRRRRRSPKKDSGGNENKQQKDGVPRKMLMNVVDPEEIRVAIVGEAGVEDLYIERGGSDYNHGNIYKGKVQNIEPSLQAAFVDIGGEKNGFLHVSDVVPPFGGYDGILKRRRRRKPSDDKRLPIEKMLYKGQEILVQITRESVSNKGPSLTTYISLPGRYLVLMPAVQKRGVSRKIQNDAERDELKRALDDLDPPKDMGFIIRTAGMGRGKDALSNDLNYLLRLWDAIVSRTKKAKPPAPIYRESDLVIRAIRDYLYDDVDELLIDGKEEFERAKEFLNSVMPGFSEKIHMYGESDPLFHKYGVEKEIESVMSRSVPLKSGGSIVIDQTEAMIAIDVNTGRFKKGDSTRETILAINMEAAAEIARQLRLRDMGGLVLIDFIDMYQAADRRRVEDEMRKVMKRDRARVTMLPISQLGVMEMTRQRVRESLRRTLFTVCPACGGSGLMKSAEVLALEFVRRLRALLDGRNGVLEAHLHPRMALAVSNAKRNAIADIERAHASRIVIVADEKLGQSDMQFNWLDEDVADM